jgi:hypothetical protein
VTINSENRIASPKCGGKLSNHLNEIMQKLLIATQASIKTTNCRVYVLFQVSKVAVD